MFVTAWLMGLFTSICCWDTVLAIAELMFLEGLLPNECTRVRPFNNKRKVLLVLFELYAKGPLITSLTKGWQQRERWGWEVINGNIKGSLPKLI